MLKDQSPINQFKNKIRTRVCGIYLENDEVLLLKHVGIGEESILWAPPGGGVEFGETTEQALIREFKEETGLDVRISRFLFTNEFIENGLHAVELFFEVLKTAGTLKLGFDPELPSSDQMIKAWEFFSEEKLMQMKKTRLHNVFAHTNVPQKLLDLQGLFTFKAEI